MNKKAFELAISTLILIILGVLVLTAITYALTDGFKKFKNTSSPFTDTSQITAIKTNCRNACENSNRFVYCCSTYKIDDQDIKCSDPRLELSCTLNCTEFECGTENQNP